ncbi:hypothetical protein D9M69_625110 [compost metagenome]
MRRLKVFEPLAGPWQQFPGRREDEALRVALTVDRDPSIAVSVDGVQIGLVSVQFHGEVGRRNGAERARIR